MGRIDGWSRKRSSVESVCARTRALPTRCEKIQVWEKIFSACDLFACGLFAFSTIMMYCIILSHLSRPFPTSHLNNSQMLQLP